LVPDARRDSVKNVDFIATSFEFRSVQTIVIHQNSVLYLIVRVRGEEVVKTVCEDDAALVSKKSTCSQDFIEIDRNILQTFF